MILFKCNLIGISLCIYFCVNLSHPESAIISLYGSPQHTAELKIDNPAGISDVGKFSRNFNRVLISGSRNLTFNNKNNRIVCRFNLSRFRFSLVYFYIHKYLKSLLYRVGQFLIFLY